MSKVMSQQGQYDYERECLRRSQQYKAPQLRDLLQAKKHVLDARALATERAAAADGPVWATGKISDECVSAVVGTDYAARIAKLDAAIAAIQATANGDAAVYEAAIIGETVTLLP